MLEKSAYYKLIKWSKGIQSTVAYIISPMAAKKLLSNINSIDTPVDTYMDKFWEHNVEQISIYPFPVKVIDDNQNKSTITRNTAIKHQSLYNKLRKLTENTINDIKRYLHNRRFAKSLSKDKHDE